jgi:acyl carrier protein
MGADIKGIVRDDFARVVAMDVGADDLDPALDMVDDYGLTSLDKVMFLTAVCKDTGVDLSNFTEEDLPLLRTLRDVTEALTRHAGSVA